MSASTNAVCLKNLVYAFIVVLLLIPFAGFSQQTANGSQPDAAKSRKISPDLFGVFFEDISYAADGGLYGQLIQNGSFEYSPDDRKEWNPLTNWEYTTKGYGYGTISVETAAPVNANNPHYVVLNIDDPGQQGVGVTNLGYDGIAVKAGEVYNFSVFIKQISAEPIPVTVTLKNPSGTVVYGSLSFTTNSNGWKKYSGAITADKTSDSARLTIVAKLKSKLAIDEVSLFPTKTFKNEPNGLRADLAQAVADIHPKFVRFPGGCLVHGDGLNNIYRWKNTIGPVEGRVQQRNIWGYNQSVGLGFYEYFRFCEDIGAKPLPIVAAGVSCQNSGGTWAIGGTGQRGIPMADMKQYVQDILDLIEYANGPVTTIWGAKRAAAGHPKPFNLQYIGIGNEDKQTPEFRDRFKMIYDEVRAKHPEITIVGTVGPAPDGEDYDLGWNFADKLSVPVVDEHFYEKPEWFLRNNHRYDNYRRNKSQVYIGEYASWGNTLYNALCEAAFMTSVERNGDVVRMASYAPLLANLKHTSWNPDLIYFNNTDVLLTANYYVQQLFSTNQGNVYIPDVITFPKAPAQDTTLAASCVKDTKTGDIILKIVNAGAQSATAHVDLSVFHIKAVKTNVQLLKGNPTDKNSLDQTKKVVPENAEIAVADLDQYTVPAYSLSVIRLKAN